jgi:hypothetical protein
MPRTAPRGDWRGPRWTTRDDARLYGRRCVSRAAVAGAGAAWWRSNHGREQPDIWSAVPEAGRGEIVLSNGAESRCCQLLGDLVSTVCRGNAVAGALPESPSGRRLADPGLAVDKEKPVQEFVTSKGIDFAIALAGNEGLALSRSLGNSAGGLPFSIALGRDGTVLARKVGALNEAMLADWARLRL